METFSAPRDFVQNSRYARDREDALAALDVGAVDEPLADLVAGFNELPHCFTLQCCYGHFLRYPGQDEHSLEPIPRGHSGPVRYRIAYMAFCLEESVRGRALRDSLAQAVTIDPGYVQFGSADWFWGQWVNSFALQVEPAARMLKDQAVFEAAEALHTQRVRDRFFGELRDLLAAELRGQVHD